MSSTDAEHPLTRRKLEWFLVIMSWLVHDWTCHSALVKSWHCELALGVTCESRSLIQRAGGTRVLVAIDASQLQVSFFKAGALRFLRLFRAARILRSFKMFQ
eukprot:1012227-Rhodomonas_salina.1